MPIVGAIVSWVLGSRAALTVLAIMGALVVGWWSGRNSEAHKNELAHERFLTAKAETDRNAAQSALEQERAAAARQEVERQSLEKQVRDYATKLPKGACVLDADGARRLRQLGR